MANRKHVLTLKKGVKNWNEWRIEHNKIKPNLIEANFRESNLKNVDLTHANLIGVDFCKACLSDANFSDSDLSDSLFINADLTGAYFNRSDLFQADLSGANLIKTHFIEADLSNADFSHSNLTEACLFGSNLSNADFTGANLQGAQLDYSILNETNFKNAILERCHIFGISVWRPILEGTLQKDLIIQAYDEDEYITVDNLEIAQFIYLLLRNEKVRDVIDTITSKVVLILGRFTPERKLILDTIRDELRNHNYVPILFDFNEPTTQDVIETVSTLAHLARFIIADLTDPKTVILELGTVVEKLPSVPVQPIIFHTSKDDEGAWWKHIKRFNSICDVYRYSDIVDLQSSIKTKIIFSVEKKREELLKNK